MAFLNIPLEMIRYFEKNKQTKNQTKNQLNKTNKKICPNPHKQIEKTVSTRFLPMQIFINFVNMKVSTVP